MFLFALASLVSFALGSFVACLPDSFWPPTHVCWYFLAVASQTTAKSE